MESIHFWNETYKRRSNSIKICQQGALLVLTFKKFKADMLCEKIQIAEYINQDRGFNKFKYQWKMFMGFIWG